MKTQLPQYSRAHRVAEMAAIIAFGALTLYIAAHLATSTERHELWIVALAAIAGYLAADLLSGLVHWLFDSWGSVDTPILGPGFIRPFREHHIDARSITRHDFIETNGNNCLASIPVLAITCFTPTRTGPELFAVAFLVFTCLGVFATNQFHKWAHMDAPGPVVATLQRWHLILPRDHHALHHAAPYATHYCITTGWLNPVLARADAYRRLERIIATVTGHEPSRDESPPTRHLGDELLQHSPQALGKLRVRGNGSGIE